MNAKNDVVITAAKRSPIGAFQGVLSAASVVDVASPIVASASGGIDMGSVNEVVMGCVLPAGVGQSPARQVALGAGLPQSVSSLTVNKVCGSGLQSVMLASASVAAGFRDVVVAGGMESMTNAPYLLPKARDGYRMGHHSVIDHMFFDGLEDAYQHESMGSFAQAVADEYQLTREEMDEFAIASLTRARNAIESGAFNNEIQALEVKNRRETIEVITDEIPYSVKPEKITQLRPAFATGGTLTAANSSSIADGAAAVCVMSQETANKLGSKPLAKIVGYTTHAIAPKSFTLAPIGAIQTLLERVDWSVYDVDLWEINEAFAMVTMIATKELNLDSEKVNVNGGACALGHPIGASGARLLVTLIHALKNRKLKKGIVSLCIGGGEAVAMAIEVL